MAEIITKQKLVEANENASAWEKYWSGNENEDVITRLNKEYPTHAKALKILMENGGFQPFETQSQLLASVPLVSPTAAKALDTKKLFLWKDGAWIDTGLSELDQAKKYVNEVNKIPDSFDNTAVYKSNGKVTFGASSDFFYKKLKVKKDEKYLIRSMDYNISKVWYLADDSLNVISESTGTPAVSDEIVTIMEDGTLYVNGLYVHALQFKFEVVTGYESKTIELSGDYPKQYYIAYIPDPADPTKIKRVTSTSVVSTVVENVRENDLFKIDAKKISDVKSYYFVADSGVIVSQEGNNEPNLKVIKVPAYASKLIVCSDVAYTNFSILKADYFGKLAYEESIKPDPVIKKNLKDYYPQQPNYRHLLQEKCPKFYNKLRNKTGDVTVCITGTSLTQGNLYTTIRSDAKTRPPLLHTNDLSSHIFDALIGYWQGQQYRRYDHTDLTYSSSDWSIKNRLIESDIDIWDDFDFKKNGLTKTTISANASVSTVIPVGAWQFNFIYRSDSQSGNCTVSIAEGNSKVEVFNGTNWVEANSFVFSMLESAVTETKGNTCYQKRLKMRCKNKASGGIDSLATAKNITISKGNNSNRFNVVGFEWSPREYMLTFINAARGSHAWGLAGSPENLENYQDSDIWEFKPDLILCEVTSINWGAGFGQALKTDPNYYVNIAKKAYFDDLGMFPNSIYQKSDHYTKCEIIFYGDTVATSVDYDTLWDANKQPKFGLVDVPAWNGSGSTENVGRVKTIFENYEAVEIYVASKPYIFIPVTQQFKQLAYDAFSNYPDAFAPTLADGDSLSFDRVHLNNNGAAFYAYLIKPLFENL
ncbi:hypothetical protein [Acinetobacter guillouiae]|uniref:hypothetical protein n=1 Tax=Acinetobacter guillouiae TaxID=106649 RepID=UPI0026E42CCE|nr:hypothetical protein [Acinetobacter guillouiae]MDO6646205.1 hypothetical protein [Acinetobacter guillouiae]